MTEKLDSMQNDFLKELANIGIGHAATSLSTMVKSKVDISLPKMSLLSVENLLALRSHNFCAVTSSIAGDLKGMILIVFDDGTSFWLIDKMSMNPQGTTKAYDDMGKAAICEFANIIGGSFLTSLSNFMGFNLMPNIPKLHVGKGTHIKDNLKSQISDEIKEVLYVRTDLKIDDQKINGEIYLILDKDSFTKVFNKMM